MPRARLTLDIPDGVWVGAVSREFPETQLRVLTALPDGEDGVGLLEVTASTELDAILAAIRDAAGVATATVLDRDPEAGEALVEFRTTVPLLLEVASEAGLPVEMPFTVQSGTAQWEVTASQDRLSELAAQLDAAGIPFEIDAVYRETRTADRLLTDRQQRVLAAAVELGYYDTPRQCTQADLADHLGIAKSTCSETLHRAEARIITEFAADQLPAPDIVSDDDSAEADQTQ